MSKISTSLNDTDSERGKLTILYHGSRAKAIKNINREGFDINAKSNFGKTYGDGFYFSPDLHCAAAYSKNTKSSDESEKSILVLRAYVNLNAWKLKRHYDVNKRCDRREIRKLREYVIKLGYNSFETYNKDSKNKDTEIVMFYKFKSDIKKTDIIKVPKIIINLESKVVKSIKLNIPKKESNNKFGLFESDSDDD